MPKTKVKDLSEFQMQKLQRMGKNMRETEFVRAVFDLVAGTDEFKLLLAERIQAAFPATGLTVIVGSTALVLSIDGATLALGFAKPVTGVATTNVFEFDGTDSYVRVSGTMYKLIRGPATGAGQTNLGGA